MKNYIRIKSLNIIFMTRFNLKRGLFVVISLAIAIIAIFIYYFLLTKNPIYGYKDDSLATNESVRYLASSINDFSIKLYKQIIKKGDENIFFSPLSIEFAFVILYEGAKNMTKEEIGNVLNIPKNDIVRRYSFARIYNLLNEENKEYELSLANAIWVANYCRLKSEYLDIINRFYPADVYNTIDLNKINQWVADRTRGKINRILDDLSSENGLVVTNAIYFKGKWLHSFDKKRTEKMDFYVSSDKVIKVDMMYVKEEFPYYETSDFQAIELPYEGNDLFMLVILPWEISGLSKVEENLNAEMINKIINSMKTEEVHVYFPKFEFETIYDLKEILKKIGMECSFDPNCANFSDIFQECDEWNKWIDKAIHKAYIKVDEEGTEASAATSVNVKFGAAPKEISKTIIFKADHPFIFFIIDRRTGTILFMGRVIDPTS